MTAQAQLPLDGFDRMTDAEVERAIDRLDVEDFTARWPKPCRCVDAFVFADDEDGEPRCALCGRAPE